MIVEILVEVVADTDVFVGNRFCPREILFVEVLENRVVERTAKARLVRATDCVIVALSPSLRKEISTTSSARPRGDTTMRIRTASSVSSKRKLV